MIDWDLVFAAVRTGMSLGVAAVALYVVFMVALACLAAVSAIASVVFGEAAEGPAIHATPTGPWAVAIVDAIQPAREVLARRRGFLPEGVEKANVEHAMHRLDMLRAIIQSEPVEVVDAGGNSR